MAGRKIVQDEDTIKKRVQACRPFETLKQAP